MVTSSIDTLYSMYRVSMPSVIRPHKYVETSGAHQEVAANTKGPSLAWLLTYIIIQVLQDNIYVYVHLQYNTITYNTYTHMYIPTVLILRIIMCMKK